MRREVVDSQEEAHAPGMLVPDDCGLAFTIRTGEEETRLRASWTHDNPALRPAVGGDGGLVFNELEPQDINEEPDRRVIVSDHERDKLEHGQGVRLAEYQSNTRKARSVFQRLALPSPPSISKSIG
jgi:hypothetical protein